MPISVEFGLNFSTSRFNNGLGGRSRIYSGHIADAPGSQIVLVGKGADNVSDAPSVADTDIYLWTREGTTSSRRRLRLATKGERITRKVVAVEGWSAGRQGEGGRGDFTYYSASVHLETDATHDPPDATDSGSSIPGDPIGGISARRDSTTYSGAMAAGGAGDQITGHSLLLFPGDIRDVTKVIGTVGPGNVPRTTRIIGRIGPGRLPQQQVLIGAVGPRHLPVNDSILIGRIGPDADIPDPDPTPSSDTILIGRIGPGLVPIPVPPDPPDPTPIPDDPPGDHGLRLLIQTGPLEYTDYSAHLLRLTGQFGRTGASYLEQVQPAVMQIQLTNIDGTLGLNSLLPRREVKFTDRSSGKDVTLLAGYIEKVAPGYDIRTRRRITTITTRGALSRIGDADHEVSILLKEQSLISEIVDQTLSQAAWPRQRMTIDRSQTRIHPAHYLRALSPRSIGLAGPVLRTLEAAEIGLLHEQRGERIHFEHRYHREVDTRDPLYTFGNGADHLRVIERVEPDANWDSVYTVMSVGGSRARILTARAMYEFGRPEGGEIRVIIDSGATWQPIVDLKRDVANRVNETVESALVWLTPKPSDYDIRRVSNNEKVPETATLITLVPISRTQARLSVSNLLAEEIVVRKMRIPGRGIALHGDLTVPPTARNTEIYGRRNLELPTSLIGNGINEADGDVVAEGRHYAHMLLARLSVSRPTVRLPINALEPGQRLASERLQIGDPVEVVDISDVPNGQYYVEGGDYEYDKRDVRLTMGVRVSQRGVKAVVADEQGIVVRAEDAVWRDVRAPIATRRGSYHVGAALVSLPSFGGQSASDEAVMRLMEGNEVARQWAERDIPVAGSGEGASWRAGLTEGGQDVRIQIRRRTGASYGLTVTGFLLVRVDG